jgi:hypothetical protein
MIELAASLEPNVATDVARLRLTLAREGDVRVDIVDAAGSVVRSASHAGLASGGHVLEIDVASLASGRYLVRIAVGGRIMSLSLVVAR